MLAILGLARYVETRKAEQARRMDGFFGEGSWRIAWRVGQTVLERTEALRPYGDT